MSQLVVTVSLLVISCFLSIADSGEIHAEKGDTLILSCNTAESSGVDWTQKRSIDGHLSYIYVNGSIVGDTNILIRFSVVNTSDGEYSLRIYNIHPFYSGWYDCYETDGRRIIGYYVVAAEAPDLYYYRTAKVGQTVKFPCLQKLKDNVDWARLDTPHTMADDIYLGDRGIHFEWHDRRFTVMDRNHSYTLVIRNVTVSDSAYYRCVEDSGFGQQHFYVLTVQDRPVYSRRDVVVGQSVELLCNTSLTPDIMWTYDTNGGYVDYIYWNGHLDRNKPRLSVKFTAVDGSHSLAISGAEVNESGLYDCYDGKGTRKAGYKLTVAVVTARTTQLVTETVTEAVDAETPTVVVAVPAVVIPLIIVIIVVVVIWFLLRRRLDRCCLPPATDQELSQLIQTPSKPVAKLDNGIYVTVEWTRPEDNSGADVTGYVIKYKFGHEDTDINNYDTWSVAGNTTSFQFTNQLEEWTRYRFAVAAVYRVGRGEFSEFSDYVLTWAVLHPDAPEPPVVSEVHATSCTVTYKPPQRDGGAPVTGYILEHHTPGPDSEWIRVNDTPVTDIQYTIDNLTPATEYEFRVAARNKTGNSDFSLMSPKILTVGKPDKPGHPEVVEVIGTSVHLQWTAPCSDGGAAVTEYKVMYRTLEVMKEISDSVAATAESLISYTIRNVLQANTKYNFAVAAVNRTGRGPWSEQLEDINTFAAVPGPPAAPVISNITSTSCIVNYEPPEIQVGGPPVTGYFLEVRALDGPWITVNNVPITGTEARVTKLYSNIRYEFRLSALNDNGRGEYSEPSAPVVPLTEKRASQPGRPVATVSGTSVNLEWSMLDDRTKHFRYVIRCREASTQRFLYALTELKTGSTIHHTLTNVTLKPHTHYVFAVAACNEAGLGRFSSTSQSVKTPSESTDDDEIMTMNVFWRTLPFYLLQLVLLKAVFALRTSLNKLTSRDITKLITLCSVCQQWRSALDIKQGRVHTLYQYVSRPYRRRALHLRSRMVKGFVRGVAQLHNVLYVVCRKSSVIRMYTADTFSPLDVVINVDGMKRPRDIVVCRHDRQLYVADWDCIWRVSVDDKSYVKWLTTQSTTDTFTVHSLSLTSRRLIVTTSPWPFPRLHQYNTTDTPLPYVVSLPGYVKKVYHGVETTHGTFVVSHWGTAQSQWKSAVSELDVTGKVLFTFPDVELPLRLSLHSEGRVLVADGDNDRILLLSSQLQLQWVLIDRNSQVKLQRPWRLCYNEHTSQLYIAHHSSEESRRSDVISLFSLH